MIDIKKHLNFIVSSFKILNKKQGLNFDVKNMIEYFVLRNAKQQKKGIKLPKNIVKGKLKSCFKNATHLALENSHLKYFEGYAISNFGIFPLLHAWVENEQGEVIDNTWNEPHKCFYFGVCFDHETLKEEIFKNEIYGLLNLGYKVNIELIKKYKNKKAI